MNCSFASCTEVETFPARQTCSGFVLSLTVKIKHLCVELHAHTNTQYNLFKGELYHLYRRYSPVFTTIRWTLEMCRSRGSWLIENQHFKHSFYCWAVKYTTSVTYVLRGCILVDIWFGNNLLRSSIDPRNQGPVGCHFSMKRCSSWFSVSGGNVVINYL